MPESGGVESGTFESGLGAPSTVSTFSIGSVLINGNEYVDKTIFSATEIVNDISNRTGEATIAVVGIPSLIGAPRSIGGSGSESGGVESGGFESGSGGSPGALGDMQPGATLQIFNQFGTLIFAGVVAKVTPMALNILPGGLGQTQFTLVAQDYCSLLDVANISTAVTYTGKTDQFIIQDLVATYCPAISTVGVDSVAVIDTITFDNVSLREAMESIILLSGAQFWVDPNKVLQNHNPFALPAPFSIGETPDGVTVFAPVRDQLTCPSDFKTGANRVKVIGALSAGTASFTATVDNVVSQGIYGVKIRVVTDRSLSSNQACLDRANVELASYGTPQINGEFSIYQTGLAVGQSLPIDWPALNRSGTFLVRRVAMTWEDQFTVCCAIQFGDYRPDLAKFLRKVTLDAKQSARPPVAIPSPFSVTPVSFASTIQPVILVISNPVLPNSNYPIGSIIENATDLKLYKNVGGAWQAVVDLSELSGTITSTQISDGSITTPKLAVNSVTAINILAGSVIAGKLAANSVVAGTLAVGAINAGDGVISNLAIGTAQIANLAVTAAKIANLAVTNAQIANATITFAKIASVDAATITVGLLSADRIGAGTMNVGAGGLTVAGAGGVNVSGSAGLSVQTNIQFGGVLFAFGNISGNNFDINTNTGVCNFWDVKGGHAIICNNFVIADTGGQLYANTAIQVSGVTVVKSRRSDIGAPSFASFADVQTWCAALRTNILQPSSGHGLMA